MKVMVAVHAQEDIIAEKSAKKCINRAFKCIALLLERLFVQSIQNAFALDTEVPLFD
jgi:hypothetical protein